MLRFLLIFLFVFATAAFADDPVTPGSYAATYAVKYRGFKVGLLTFTLQQRDDGTYVYESRAKPGLLARLVVSPEAVERTVVVIDDSGVRPLSWLSEDGTSDTADDGRLTFDWDAQQITGTVEDNAVTLPAEPGLQDRLSMQVAVLVALLRAAPPGTITLIDEDRIKHYDYVQKGSAQLEALGKRYDTILYESTREGSSRLKRIYHAPALGYLPVRFEHLKNGKLETVLELVEISPAHGAWRSLPD